MTDTANAQTDVALDGRPFGTGFSRFLGVVLTEAGPHRTRAWAQTGPQRHQEAGIVHGGWYASVVDAAR